MLPPKWVETCVPSIQRYNEIVEEVETDPSMKIQFRSSNESVEFKMHWKSHTR